jgi:hypothetical protein
MELGDDTKVVLLAGGLIFLWALCLGVMKYRQMLASPVGQAHFYTDTAHRAALLYSFASLLLATFVELSDWSTAVNLIAAGSVIFFFVAAIGAYNVQGIRQKTDNQIRDRVPGLKPYMVALIAAEIGGFSVLLAGFVSAQIL